MCGKNLEYIPNTIYKMSEYVETFKKIFNMKTLIQKGTCISVFVEALFTIAKIWKQPKCPSTDEWIKKMWYILIYNNGILFSHKKE